MNRYDKGDQVKCSVTFADAAGAVEDPTAIVFRWKNPPGVIKSFVYNTDLALVKDEKGIYHVNLAPTVHGIWYYRFEGTGAVVAAAEFLH